MHARTVRLFAVVAAAALTASIGVTTVGARAEQARDEMDRWRAQLRARHAQKLSPRDPAWGAPVAGNAFTHYEHAATLADAFDDAADVRPKLTASDEALCSAAGRANWQPVVAAVLAGAPCERCEFPRDDRVFGCANLLTYRRAANLTVLEARARRHEGRDSDAVRLTLAAMAMGAACVDDGVLVNQMVGAAIVAIAVDSWTDRDLRSAPEAALRALRAGLQRLDDRLPATLDLDAELAQMATALLDVPDQRAWAGGGTWRYGFSAEWMCADAFLALAEAAERLRAADALDWPRRQALFDVELERLATMTNTAAQVIAPHLDACERQLRWNLTHLRLLRQAVARHLHEPETLQDPLGAGPLRVTVEDGAYVLSSAGDDDRRQLRREVRPRDQSTGARSSRRKR